jgi:N-acetylmuramoyl-L-alanine amidase
MQQIFRYINIDGEEGMRSIRIVTTSLLTLNLLSVPAVGFAAGPVNGATKVQASGQEQAPVGQADSEQLSGGSVSSQQPQRTGQNNVSPQQPQQTEQSNISPPGNAGEQKKARAPVSQQAAQQKTVYIRQAFYTYNGPSLSSGIADYYGPQTVTVLEEGKDGWIKISTYKGPQWMNPNGVKRFINNWFNTYNGPSVSSGVADYYGPQTVTVLEEGQDGWIKISTYKGPQWMNPNGVKLPISSFFFTYKSPNIQAAVSDIYGPQRVIILEQRQDGWARISTYLGDKWVNLNTVTGGFALLNAPIIGQFPELANGCEVVSLQMLMEYYGHSFNKVFFAYEMPFDTTPLVKYSWGGYKQWGDPSVGFVGDVTGKTPGFSIDPAPLKKLLTKYIKNGADLTGSDFSVVEAYVRNSRPVVAWVTVGLNNPRSPVNWQTPSGKTITAHMNTHAVLVTGVDDNYVYYNDPYTGIKNSKTPKGQFVNVYNLMGRKALSVR